MLVAWVALAAVGRADDLDLQLRASWGGGTSTSWTGWITVSSGTLQIDGVLGLEADAPGVAVESARGTIKIIPRMPRSYDGLDFTVRAPRDAVLSFHLISATNQQTAAQFKVPLADLIGGRSVRDLDAAGNRFAVGRTSGDLLRFATARDHLVFTGGEELQAKLTPHLIASAPSTSAKCSLRLVAANTKAAIWQQELDVTLDEQGTSASLDLNVPLPKEEGVYDLFLELYPKRFTAPLVRGKALAERQVQVVVLAEQRSTTAVTDWAVIGEFDPAHPKLWERMLRLPTMKIVPGLSKGPLGNEAAGTREHLGGTWSTLNGSAWQAYPLPVGEIGRPHLLELEFPSDVEQSLSISVLEPNAAGMVAPIGLDSGIDVVDTAARTPRVQVHKLVFWPRTKSPLVLLANRRSNSQAVFGRVRVSAGPTRLTDLPGINGASDDDQRLVAAFFQNPLFPENFSVADGIDARSNRAVDDWQGFHQGATRLAEYLKFAGRNAAVVSVLSEGSAIYPSQLLHATPRYDMGAFATLASDPVRKDVLELALRVFDRERLQFVPSLDFSAPLPELEELLAQTPRREVHGIEVTTPSGERWCDVNPTRRGAGAYYNVLDPRVQQAMRRVIVELAKRYQEHPSLSGIAITLSGDGYAQLPDDACACDNITLARFAADCELKLPAADTRRPAARFEWIQQHARQQWITWRAEQVTQFYQAIRDDLNEVEPQLHLLLCPTDPIRSRSLHARLKPAFPQQDQLDGGLLCTGIDAARLAKIPGLTVLRSRTISSAASPEFDGVRTELNSSESFDRLCAAFETPGSVNISQPLSLRLEAFDKVSPFGAQNTHTYLFSHLSATGPEARKALIGSLAASDSHLLLDGGAMLPLGQEDEQRSIVQTLRTIPAQRFESVPATADGARTQPVTLRSWSGDGATWLYLVNNSPWPVIADVDLESAGAIKVATVGPKPRVESLTPAAGVVHWKVRLDAYDLVAARISAPAIVVSSWQTQVDRAVDVALREQIRDIRLRANLLRSPPALESLANSGFESKPSAAEVPHWSASSGPGATVELDRQAARQGETALHLVSKSPGRREAAPVVWVRSDPFPTPSTGRLAIWVWLKIPDERRQPKLRLAIEGRLDGQPYYRRANLGATEDGRPVQPLKEAWAPYLFPVDDLPDEGLTNLQIGFDLMGEGEVWIDDVQLHELWFQDPERKALLKSIELADFHVQEGKIADALHYLDSYWPQFLKRHVAVDSPRVAALTPPPPIPAPIPPPAKAGMFDGVRRWVPRLPFQK